MKKFLIAEFKKWATKKKISNKKLNGAIADIENSLAVNLGGSLYKTRISRSGEGKRKGYRVLIVCKLNNKAFFLAGYSKKDKDNITAQELVFFKDFGKGFLNLSLEQLHEVLKDEKIFVLKDDE